MQQTQPMRRLVVRAVLALARAAVGRGRRMQLWAEAGPAARSPVRQEDSDDGRRDWWQTVRVLLQVTEAWSVLAKHEALAIGARACVLIGDALFGLDNR